MIYEYILHITYIDIIFLHQYHIIATVRFYKSNHNVESNSIETVFMNIFITILHR